ncbi:hypothetical protein VUR80DRAFT_9462 [Thermomyces stellatus]
MKAGCQSMGTPPSDTYEREAARRLTMTWAMSVPLVVSEHPPVVEALYPGWRFITWQSAKLSVTDADSMTVPSGTLSLGTTHTCNR